MTSDISRRQYMAMMGAAPAFMAAAPAFAAGGLEDREQRMRWWHEAKFGMFVHWGLYSVLGRHEWAMEQEGIPVSEYEPLADGFLPTPNAPRAWARLARQAGMKYMVMTTKHHEGFCLFNSKLTDYCAPKKACKRDMVQEYVAAARAEGLRVGFYYSLMDWHHPDGARCLTDEAARKRFIAYIHGQIRELLSNYGKIDILWYDVSWPLDAAGWESERMNRMVYELQPEIIVNNRNQLDGDFSTPEQRIQAAEGKSWEACMTMNDSWGYQAADDNWKTPKTIVRNLITCARQGGNYLLNIGPRHDGSIPEESVGILSSVGRWMAHNADTIHGAEPCQVSRSNYCSFTRKGNTLFVHAHFWPGQTLAVAGLTSKVQSVKMHVSGQPVRFEQEKLRIRCFDLPATPADDPVTTLEFVCDGEPHQDSNMVRVEHERAKHA